MVLKSAGGRKGEKSGTARSTERGKGTREASSIWTTFFEASPAATPGLEKRVWGKTGHPLPALLSSFPNEMCAEPFQCSLVSKLSIIKRSVLNRLIGMTKRQFVALADSIREHNRLAKFNGENAFTVGQLAALERFCASQNPRFKRERWLDYIAG